MNALARFKEKWSHPSQAAVPVSLAQLEAVGLELGIAFPPEYLAAVVEAGAVRTTLGLSHVIGEKANASFRNDSGDFFHMHPISELHEPADVLGNTQGWREAGMPECLVAIGSDLQGNSFCFDARELPTLGRKSQAIYFWDHDFDETTLVAPDYETWIESYLQLEGDYDSWKMN